MKLSKLYEAAWKAGMSHDPRGVKQVKEDLKRTRKKFDKMDDGQKEYFDRDALKNPYSDSRILCGSGKEDIRKVMMGIDIDVQELLLARRLNDGGAEIDLVWSHHPGGRAYAKLHDVMMMQADILADIGVPISAAESLMSERAKEIERRLLPVNHRRAADGARLLDMPLLCTHTPADNMVARYLQVLLDGEKPSRLNDIVDLLMTIPEYQDATRHGVGPRIVLGTKERRAGKIFVDMTGGTSSNKKLFEKIAAAGLNTIVGMHISDDYRKEAQKHHLHVVIAGHISSDTLGMNLLVDAVQKSGGHALEVVECSGFRRFPRR
jgi:hypothetical protein